MIIKYNKDQKIKTIDSVKYGSSVRYNPSKKYLELEFILKYIIKEKQYPEFAKYLLFNIDTQFINMLCRDNNKLKNAYKSIQKMHNFQEYDTEI